MEMILRLIFIDFEGATTAPPKHPLISNFILFMLIFHHFTIQLSQMIIGTNKHDAQNRSEKFEETINAPLLYKNL